MTAPPSEPSATPRSFGRARLWLGCLGLAIATVALYAPVREFGFIDYDDPDYVTANAHVARGLTADGVRWAFTSAHAANYHPLTWLSHMLDVELFGMRAGPMLLVNVAIHAASACVLLILLTWTTGWFGASLAIAAVFALHPLRLESVAWVSERKDVLGTFFFLLTLLAYARYARRPSAMRYVAVLVTFALGLLSKPMVVTAPCAMLLLDYWPLGRFRTDDPDRWGRARKLVAEKLPLLALVVASSVATYAVQSEAGAVKQTTKYALRNRLENVPVAYVRYVWKTVWPARLSLYYPHPGRWPAAAIVLSTAGVLGASIAAVMLAPRAPYCFVGWFWFLGTLVPVIGIVQVGTQSIADRYTYIPGIGLAVAIVFAISEWIGASSARRLAATSVAIAVIVGFALTTRVQLKTYWAGGTLTLFQRAAEVTEDNWLAYGYIGSVLARGTEPNRAADYFRRAVELNPSFAEAHYNWGNLLARQADFSRAIARYERATDLRRPFPQAWNNRGVAEVSLGDLAAAERSFRTALAQQPDYAEARANLSKVLSMQGRPHD